VFLICEKMKGDTSQLKLGEPALPSSASQTEIRKSNPQSSENVRTGGSSRPEFSQVLSPLDEGFVETTESQGSVQQSESPGGSEGTAEVNSGDPAQETAEVDDNDPAQETAEVDDNDPAQETAEADDDDSTSFLEGLSPEQLRKIQGAIDKKLGEKRQKAGPKSELEKSTKESGVLYSTILMNECVPKRISPYSFTYVV
jgi:hypothetical protein